MNGTHLLVNYWDSDPIFVSTEFMFSSSCACAYILFKEFLSSHSKSWNKLFDALCLIYDGCRYYTCHWWRSHLAFSSYRRINDDKLKAILFFYATRQPKFNWRRRKKKKKTDIINVATRTTPTKFACAQFSIEFVRWGASKRSRSCHRGKNTLFNTFIHSFIQFQLKIVLHRIVKVSHFFFIVFLSVHLVHPQFVPRYHVPCTSIGTCHHIIYLDGFTVSAWT